MIWTESDGDLWPERRICAGIGVEIDADLSSQILMRICIQSGCDPNTVIVMATCVEIDVGLDSMIEICTKIDSDPSPSTVMRICIQNSCDPNAVIVYMTDSVSSA